MSDSRTLRGGRDEVSLSVPVASPLYSHPILFRIVDGFVFAVGRFTMTALASNLINDEALVVIMYRHFSKKRNMTFTSVNIEISI